MSGKTHTSLFLKGKHFAVIGGDKRLYYLYEALKKDGCAVTGYALALSSAGEQKEYTLSDALANADAVILPYPLSPDGVFLNTATERKIPLCELFAAISLSGAKQVFAGAVKAQTEELAKVYGITLCDYGADEALTQKNALCTVEGALGILISELPITISGSRFTVLGYGRIGRIMSQRLKALGAEVNAVARKSRDFAMMSIDGVKPYNYSELESSIKGSAAVINTVPAMILDESTLVGVKGETLILDLASSPGGVDREAAKRLGKRVIWALSLPGKTAPKSAAMIIKETVLDTIEASGKYTDTEKSGH